MDKYNFAPGDMIKGTVTLNLKKPTNARELRIGLIGKQKTRQMTNRGYQTSYQQVYDFWIPLSGEQEYQAESFPFEFKVPSDILSMKTQREAVTDKLEDKLGAVGSLIGTVTMGQTQTYWNLRVQLDVPRGIDVKRDQDIVISK